MMPGKKTGEFHNYVGSCDVRFPLVTRHHDGVACVTQHNMWVMAMTSHKAGPCVRRSTNAKLMHMTLHL